MAVVAVLLYHAHYPWAIGGYLGVDVFFVLSGFLITRVLLSTHRSWWGYRDFLVRRAVRLMPALLAAITGVLVLVAVVGTEHDRAVAGPCSAASVAYLMNLPFAEALGCPAVWHVTWSLASEQQFYLLWPLLLAALLAPGLRRGRANGPVGSPQHITTRWRWAGLVALCLYGVEVLWQVVQRVDGVSTARVAYAPDGRSLVLLLGCALALLAPSLRRRARPSLSRDQYDVLGGVALVTLVICFVAGGLGSDLAALVPLVAAGLASVALVAVAAYAPQDARLPRVLGAAPVAWLGRISYSLYLWHEVAYRLAETVAPRGSLTAEVLRYLLALGLAAASYEWIEQAAQRPWGRRRTPAAAARETVSG